ncbi:MAG: transcription antitermination factor NusB [Alphaproteobacteria bacterium]
MPTPPIPTAKPELEQTDVWQQGEDAFPKLRGSLTGDSRTEARVCAVQCLFAAKASGVEVAEMAADLLDEVKARKADKVLFAVVTAEAGESAARYQTLIKANLVDEWPFDRLDPVHIALLWAAAAELTARPETPAKVVMNEFINIAKGFASKPSEVGFINVVLEKMSVAIRG